MLLDFKIMSNTGEHLTSLAALERFVVDNDDLLALEERIGRFNIFDSLGIARAEIRHSNFLAWLLDPGESHGQGSLFLRAILMDLLRQAPPELRPLSPVELDGEELRGVEVRREWRNVDLLVTCDEPPFVIAIENKVDSSEHSGQLARYRKVVAEHAPRRQPMYVYLTIDGDEPSEADWVPYTYADIWRVLTRVRNTNATSIGDDVLAFLDHYLRLIGSRFMDNEKIEELCQKIYRNHRQALELIFERVVANRVTLSKLAEMIDSSPGWMVCHQTASVVYFAPQAWCNAGLVGPEGMESPLGSFMCGFVIRLKERGIEWELLIGPANEENLRRQVMAKLTADELEFRLRPRNDRALKQNWVIWLTKEERQVEADEPLTSMVVGELIQTQLDELAKRFAGVPDALRPIVEQWEREKGRASTV